MKLKIALLIVGVICGLFVLKVYGAITAPDLQCTKIHETSTRIPKDLTTAEGLFELGNYHYDLGKCKEAIDDYSKALQLNPQFTRAYNNRAYTNMRLHNYKDALRDLDTAIAQDPTYVTALMNRGDMYNYYYKIDRQKAIADYNRVIAIDKEKDASGSVCGHKSMAETNGIIPLAILKVITHTDCK